MRLTKLKFYKNTPLNNFIDTIHFDSISERDAYFTTFYTGSTVKEFTDINFLRTRDPLVLSLSMGELMGFNYGSFVSEFEPNLTYFFYVISYQYINDDATNIHIVIDPVMSFTQGSVLEQLRNLTIERQHLSFSDYNKYELQLRTNDDVLKTTTKQYVHQSLIRFESFHVVFTSGVDLRKPFGNVDDPKLNSSKGQVMDNITSPLDLYVTTKEEFQNLMDSLSPYPWVTQTFNKISSIPSDFIENAVLEKVAIKDVDFGELYTFKNNFLSDVINFTEHKQTFEDLCKLFFIDPIQEKHLLRSEYTTTEIYTWDGQALLLDNGFIHDLELKGVSVIGYQNEVAIFPLDYKTTPTEQNLQTAEISLFKGSFLNDAIILNAFSDIPIMINNATLSMANSANKRALAESKLIGNRLQNIAEPNADVSSRIYDSMNVVGNLNVTQFLGRMNNQYEFYQNQKAEQLDLAMSVPTITNQSNSYGLQTANGFFGLTTKHAMPSLVEFQNVRRYYQMFGYETTLYNAQLSGVHTNQTCNYLKFSGSWYIENIPVEYIELLRVQFEKGVRFWHYNGTKNPIIYDGMRNPIIK